jgi:hypothetical protein
MIAPCASDGFQIIRSASHAFMTVHRRSFLLVPSYALLMVLMLEAGAARAHAQNSGETGLTASQVVARLVQKNAERANALERYQGRRSYRLDYVGFPENLHAEMIVDVSYKAPNSKEFKVLSESGSTWIVNHILKRLLKSETKLLKPQTGNAQLSIARIMTSP